MNELEGDIVKSITDDTVDGYGIGRFRIPKKKLIKFYIALNPKVKLID